MSFEGQEHNLRHTSIDKCLEIGGKDKPTVVRKAGLLLARPNFKSMATKVTCIVCKESHLQAVESQEIEKFT